MATRPAGRAHEQALLDEERLVDVLDGLGRLADADGERRQPDRARRRSARRAPTGRPGRPCRGRARRRRTRPGRRAAVGVVDDAVAAHLGEVAHPAQQPVGDAGGAPGPAGDLRGARRVDGDAEDAGGPHDDGLEVGGLVVVEPGDEAEAVAQRAGDQAGAGGGADQREAGQVEADRAGRRALAEHDVELEVLHRRVEDLLDGAGEPVDLVDEEHVALVELGEDGGEVAGPLEGRARGDVQADAHLGGDDAGEASSCRGRAGRRTAGGRRPGRGGGPPRG